MSGRKEFAYGIQDEIRDFETFSFFLLRFFSFFAFMSYFGRDELLRKRLPQRPRKRFQLLFDCEDVTRSALLRVKARLSFRNRPRQIVSFRRQFLTPLNFV